jgi:hypothetical protein
VSFLRNKRASKRLIPTLLVMAALALPAFAVDGIVLNSTTGRPQPNVDLTLVQPGQNGMQQLGQAKSDAQGNFKIDVVIPPGPGLLQATYQGATYNSIITPGMPTTGVEVMVYESTNKTGIAKTAEHLILLEPGADLIRVSETFVISNETKTTYNDPAKGNVRFFLPKGSEEKAQVVISAPGGMPITRPAQRTDKPGFFKFDYPLKPGDTRVDITYTVPTAPKFSGKVAASDAATHLVTPSSVTLTGDGIESAGQEPQTQARIYNLTGLEYNVLVEGQGSLRRGEQSGGDQPQEDTGAPKVEIGQARIYSRLGWVLGLTFGILALGGTMLYRRGAA